MRWISYWETRLCPANDHCLPGWPETLDLYRKRTDATVSVGFDFWSSLSIQAFEGSRFVRGGRYGISIDFSLEVVERESTCRTNIKSKFIDLTMKRRLRIALTVTRERSFFKSSLESPSLESPMSLALGTR